MYKPDIVEVNRLVCDIQPQAKLCAGRHTGEAEKFPAEAVVPVAHPGHILGRVDKLQRDATVRGSGPRRPRRDGLILHLADDRIRDVRGQGDADELQGFAVFVEVALELARNLRTHAVGRLEGRRVLHHHEVAQGINEAGGREIKIHALQPVAAETKGGVGGTVEDFQILRVGHRRPEHDLVDHQAVFSPGHQTVEINGDGLCAVGEQVAVRIVAAHGELIRGTGERHPHRPVGHTRPGERIFHTVDRDLARGKGSLARDGDERAGVGKVVAAIAREVEFGPRARQELQDVIAARAQISLHGRGRVHPDAAGPVGRVFRIQDRVEGGRQERPISGILQRLPVMPQDQRMGEHVRDRRIGEVKQGINRGAEEGGINVPDQKLPRVAAGFEDEGVLSAGLGVRSD